MKKKKCTHEDWIQLPVPNEGTYRCAKCDALGYVQGRPLPGRPSGAPRLYRCRKRGCKGVVIERRYGTGWNLENGCSDHPVRTSKKKPD